jgi:hypothetical protein
LTKIRELLTRTDVFIFTFGLTECWVSKADGSAYPMCPGTAAGSFDPDKYMFKNLSFKEIYEDTVAFMALAKQFNPKMKFIFTVSPVPLVATASESHVLPATVYSKSVLRAVAGQLHAEFEDVDYFPSYDIITSISARSMFYNPDLRTVNPRGVDYVMSHFFAQHRPFSVEQVPEGNEPVLRDPKCDELLLDQR